jgi:anti-anti-sigma factor
MRLQIDRRDDLFATLRLSTAVNRSRSCKIAALTPVGVRSQSNMEEQSFAPPLRLHSLWRYPVKSMGGEELDGAELTAGGLLCDRANALVYAQNKGGTAKRRASLLNFQARFVAPPQAAEARSAFIEGLQDPTIRAVVIDFSDIEYFGSILLDILCQVWKHLRRRGAKTALCNLPDIAHEIMRKCRLDTLWKVCPSRQSAIDALRPKGA